MNESMWNASSYTPSKLFDGWCFRVPDYQRGYAWEEDQLNDFLEDLQLLPKGSVHYTGNMVLQHAEGQEVEDKFGKTYSVYNVVDGQQRLTTVVLLLAAIRARLIELNERDLADGIYSTYLAVLDRNGQTLPKLTLNSDCHAFFLETVLQDNPHLDGARIRSHRNLRFATEHFSRFLTERKDSPNSTYREWLKELRDKICKQLVLTVYPVQRDADAGVIFEVMNNRGKPITELEKTKNYLLYLASKLELPAPHDLPKQINDAWTRIFTMLMSSGCAAEDNENQLLRVHWLMAYDPEEKRWDGCKSIKSRFHLRNYVGKHDILLGELTEYVRGFVDAARAYCDVLAPTHSNAFAGLSPEGALRRRVVESAEKLPRLHVFAPFLPLLIAVRMKYPGDWALYHEVVAYCELYAFRVYRLLLKRSNAGRREFIRLAHSVYAGRAAPQGMITAVRNLITTFSRETEIEGAYAFDPDADWYDWTGLRYFLYEYETHLTKAQNKDDVKISWKELEKLKHSIEHILPQTPACDYWLSRWDESQRAKYTNDIGNLCLTRDNSSYGNKSFPDKKGEVGSGHACYANGNFVMERNLTVHVDWTDAQLLQRRQELVNWAIKRWALPTSRPTRFDWTVPPIDVQWRFRSAELSLPNGRRSPGPRWDFRVPPITHSWVFRQALPFWQFTAPLITSEWRFIP
ncbi:MAG: DUF262 domain-containing protein [Thermoguttaceae bacterium]